MMPLLPFVKDDGTPWHSSQSNTLPAIYVQNASLEIAWTRVVFEIGSIAGNSVVPWVSSEYDGFDINNPEDWERAESLVTSGTIELPNPLL